MLTQTKPKARSAPRDGYDFEAKAKYRLELWQSIRDELGPALWGEAHVGILPSSEGLEIDTLVALGMQPNRIHAFDRSAAILATAKWRKVYPEVRVYAGEIGRTIGRVAEAGHKLRALNLDLCGGFTAPMVQTVSECISSESLHDAAVVAVTAMKGRESPSFFTALGIQSQPSRADALLALCDDRRLHSYDKWMRAHCVVDVIHRGAYKSSRVVMEYAVARVTRQCQRYAEQAAYSTAWFMLDYSARKAQEMSRWYENSTSTKARWIRDGFEDTYRNRGELTLIEHKKRRQGLDALYSQLPKRWSFGISAKTDNSFQSWFSLGCGEIDGVRLNQIHARVVDNDALARGTVPYWNRDESFVDSEQDVMRVLHRAHAQFLQSGELPRLAFSKDCSLLMLWGGN